MKYQYKTESIEYYNLEEINIILNNSGDEGWELIHISGSFCYFKKLIEAKNYIITVKKDRLQEEEIVVKLENVFFKTAKERADKLFNENIHRFPELKINIIEVGDTYPLINHPNA